MAQREDPTIESAGLGVMARMAQREDPTIESAGLGAMAQMAQRKDPTIKLIGLGALAAQEPNNKISCHSSMQWQRERSNNNFSCLGRMAA